MYRIVWNQRSLLMAVAGAVLLTACQPQDTSFSRRQEALIIHVPGDFATIQGAIDAAAIDDIIQVAAGDFTESLIVKPGLILMGAGMDQTVLHGRISLESGDHHVVTGFRVTREGSSVSPSGAGIAKDCTGRPGVTLTRNQVDGFGTGIALADCSQVEVTRNLIKRNQRGLVFTDTGGQVTDNLVLYNQKAGVVLTGCGMNFAANTVVGNGFSEAVTEGGAGLVTIGSNADHAHNNIVVSNNAGFNVLEIANDNFSHNLVWGNSVDYAGHAAAAPTDLSADPLFVDIGNDDFHLRRGSPALDAGADSEGTEIDFDGVSRPQGAAVDLGAYEQGSSSPTRRLVISEVMANPVDEDRGEFVEVFNTSEVPVELAGLILSDGDARDVLGAFQGGSTELASGAYAVIVDPEYQGGYDIPAGVTQVTVANTTLGNGLSTSDAVTLYADSGATALATFSHPFDPGNGVSAERLDLAGQDVETNWRASPCTHSAGRPNCAPVTLATGLIISEIMSNPLVESRGEFVELFNGTDDPIDVANAYLSDGDASDVLLGWDGGTTVLAGKSYAVVLDPDWLPSEIAIQVDPSALLLTVGDSALGSGLAVDDPVTLMRSDGAVLDTYSRTLAVSDGKSVEKVSLSMGDADGNWAQSSCPTGSSPGRLNCTSSASAGPRKPLVITEVMANPLDEDSGEFIELFNRGVDAVDTAGLILGDGDAVDVLVGFQGGSTLVPGGGYALILDAEYAGGYTLPPTAVLLSTPDTTLGSSLGLDDAVRLFEANGVEVIDSFRHPFNPGNGRSAERIDVRAFDTPANWTASTCETGSSPGAHNCAATESGLPKQVRFTEILSNQVGVETGGAGEFVELLNVGDRSLDLAGMFLECGPAGSPSRDTLIAFGGGPTIVRPGATAVILDVDYDDRYAIATDAVTATLDDANFGSSGLATTHMVSLYDADGITLLASFAFPSDPGDGVSLHRISLGGSDSASNWVPTPCGATPGAASCPGSVDVTSYTSFWVDRYGDEGGIYWYQAIGWPEWHDPICELNIVCPGGAYGYTYRDNFPATQSFSFSNPYTTHAVVFTERSSATDDCGGMPGNGCTGASLRVEPGATAVVPASSLGYYYAQTVGPTLNSLDWFGGDPALYWALPPDGILAPFVVEVPLP